MIKFSECTISKAIEHGTNLSCIKGRTIVCRVIKGFVVAHDNNIVKFEEGDIVVCSPNMDINGAGYKCIGICLSEENYIKSLSSDSFIKRDEDDFWQYKADCSLEQFKERFEVLDEETTVLESCIEKSKNCYNFLRDKKTSVYCIQRKYQSKANFRQGALGATLLIVGVGTFIATLTAGCSSNVFSRYMEKAPFWITMLIMVILASLVMGAILGAIFCWSLSEEDAFECFVSKKIPLLDKAEEEYKEYRSNTINELDTFRRKIGWLAF